MKKLLSALALAALVPITSFAICLSDINNNPTQYYKVTESADAETYINTATIQSLRSSPPFYAVRGTVYNIWYSKNLILEAPIIFSYDYNKSSTDVMLNLIIDNQLNKNEPKKSPEQITDETFKQLEKDTGINWSSSTFKIWTLDGNCLKSGTSKEENRPVKFNSNLYTTATYIFKKCYSLDF